MERFKLYVEELYLLLNSITEDKLYFELPHFKLKLFSIDYLNGELLSMEALENLKSLEGMAKTLLGREICEEIPTLDAFRDSLLSSGVLTPPNLDALLSKINIPRESIEEPEEVYLALDTNVFYNALLSNISHLLKYKPRVVVSHCTLNELTHVFLEHLKPGEVSKLRKILSIYGEQVYTRNTRAQKGRRAAAAIREYERVKTLYKVYETRGDECRGDKAIIEDFYRYSRKFRGKLLFLTFDNESRIYAYNKGIRNLYLETPPLEKLSNIPLHKLAELIYHLAVNFLTVKITGDKSWVKLYSWWRGQKIEEATGGVLLAFTPMASEVSGKLVKARKMRELVEFS